MFKVITVGLLVLMSFSACSKKNEVIAKIGNDKITAGILEERMQEAPPSYIGFLSTDSGKKQFLDLLIRERVVIEAARKEGIARSKEYTEALKDFKIDQEKRLRDFKESMLMEQYIKKLNTKRIAASDQEIENYYKENKKDFLRPIEVTARHILLDTQEEAVKILERVKSGEDFEKLAKVFSKDSVSAQRGGLIGPFKKGDLVPEFEKAVFPLKVNEVSEVVKTQFGYHVIKKASEKVLPAITYDDSKNNIKNIIQKVKFDDWLSETKKKYGLKIYYDRLKKVVVRMPADLAELMGSEAGAKQPIAKRTVKKK